jgi:hypothetical protein
MAVWVVFSALLEKGCCADSFARAAQSYQVYRSSTKAILESVMGRTFVRPYCCVDCDCQVCVLPTDKRHAHVLKHSLA